MKLRFKVTAMMTAAFVIFLGVALTIQREVVLPSFQELEREHARMDMKRAEQAVQRESEHLGVIDASRMHRISEQLRVPVSLHAIDGSDLPELARPALETLQAAPYDVALHDVSDEQTTALAYLRDEHGDPVGLLRADVRRDITTRGEMAVGVAVGTLAAASALVLAFLLLLLQRMVVAPLAQLTGAATRIGRTGDLTHSVAMPRSDEIGTLSRELDGMVRSLASSRTAVMDAARESGMAEVASGVLHNVGNLLNSLNVSADVLIDGVERSELSGLDDLAALLDSKGDELSEFLTDPGRAAQVREFVTQLAELRRAEFEACQHELLRLQSNLGNVAHIIASQQSLAVGRAISEPVSLFALANDAATMIGPTFRRHGVDLVVDVDVQPTMDVDRVRLLQVIVNLLTNAKHAVKQNPRGERSVSVVGRLADPKTVEITVTDNGVGIDAETLPRLFSQGFTTRSTGTGIGLHYCAVTVSGMGGEIAADSEGPGRGSTFTLRVPLRAAVREEVLSDA